MSPAEELAHLRAELERRRDDEKKSLKSELAKRDFLNHLKANFEDWQERYEHIDRTVFNNKWIAGRGYMPHPKQLEFLAHYDKREVFFGGAGAGGKSQALWFAALQHVDVPGYSALILRRTYADLAKSGALMDRSRQYLTGTDAVWNERDKKWTFPSGASITFGYLQNENDKYQYAGGEYQFIAFDELTHFIESQYTFLFSRLRKTRGGRLGEVPLRMRSASNPGSTGHLWVKNRFVNHDTKADGVVYVPSRMQDNPSTDIEGYKESLKNLDPITRRQMEEGDWSAVEGGRFSRKWFDRRWKWDVNGIDAVLIDHRGEYRFRLAGAPLFVSCDPASSSKTSADFTVFSVWANAPRGDLVWIDCIRRQVDIPEQPKLLQEVYNKYQFKAIGIEAVASNQSMLQYAQRLMLPAYRLTPKGLDKLAHAQQAMILAEQGMIWLPDPSAKPEFPFDDVLTELTLFTGTKADRRDDTVDSVSYACDMRIKMRSMTIGPADAPGSYNPRTATPRRS